MRVVFGILIVVASWLVAYAAAPAFRAQVAEARQTVAIIDAGRLGQNQWFYVVKDAASNKCMMVVGEGSPNNGAGLALTSQPWPCY